MQLTKSWLKYTPEAYLKLLRSIRGPSFTADFRGYDAIWVNSRFLAVVAHRIDPMFGEIDHVMVQNAKGGKDVMWADLQSIKNDLFGEERVALQVFPAESNLVNKTHTYHIHVLSESESKAWTERNLLAIQYMK